MNKFSRAFAQRVRDSFVKEKLEELEKKTKKKSNKPEITRAQKILLLYYVGALDSILKLETTTKQKAKLLSILLDLDKDNIEGDLSNINLKDSKIKTETNLELVLKILEDLGLKKESNKLHQELNLVLKQKDKHLKK